MGIMGSLLGGFACGVGSSLLGGIFGGGGGGGGGGTGSMKALYDMQVVANRQNLQDNLHSQQDQYFPGGSITYKFAKDPSAGNLVRGTQTMNLDPEQQAIYDAQSRIAQGISDWGEGVVGGLPVGELDMSGLPDYQYEYDLSGLPSLPGAEGYAAERQRVEDALYDRLSGRLNDYYDVESGRHDTRLASMGLDPGGEAYRTSQETFGDVRNRAYEDAAMQAILAGGQEQNRLSALDQSARNQGLMEQSTSMAAQNEARRMGLAEALTQRSLPQADLQFAQTGMAPQYNAPAVNTYSTAAPNLLAAGMAQSAANQQQQSQNYAANMGGLGSLFKSVSPLIGKWIGRLGGSNTAVGAAGGGGANIAGGFWGGG